MTVLGRRRLRRRSGPKLLNTALLLVLGGCSLLPAPRAREVFVEPGAEAALSSRRLTLEALSVDAGVATAQVRENALHVYDLLIRKINAGRDPDASPAPLRVVVTIREAPFVSGFETKNAASVETRVFAGAGPIVIALYSEETESTIASYRYLYDIIETSLSEVFR